MQRKKRQRAADDALLPAAGNRFTEGGLHESMQALCSAPGMGWKAGVCKVLATALMFLHCCWSAGRRTQFGQEVPSRCREKVAMQRSTPVTQASPSIRVCFVCMVCIHVSINVFFSAEYLNSREQQVVLGCDCKLQTELQRHIILFAHI
jgi:hypothetical protein